jgi:hypothetical protein
MDMNERSRMPLAGIDALNQAFWDLGLRFHWDAATWSVLVGMESLEAQIAYYLEHWHPHLLASYDPRFLAAAVQSRLAAPANGRLGMEAFTGE